MKTLKQAAGLLKANAEKRDYTGSMTPLNLFRASWGDLSIEYYHRARDGKTVLAVRATGQRAEDVQLNLIRQEFNVPANSEHEQKERKEDASFTDKWEWERVKQAALLETLAPPARAGVA